MGFRLDGSEGLEILDTPRDRAKTSGEDLDTSEDSVGSAEDVLVVAGTDEDDRDRPVTAMYLLLVTISVTSFNGLDYTLQFCHGYFDLTFAIDIKKLFKQVALV